MHPSFRKWFRIALLDLGIVVFLGVILRYKIAFSLPFIDQKNLLQSHSHFAFAGWITQCLMTFFIAYLSRRNENALSRYKTLLICNMLTAFGMLISFPYEGYGPVSIIFSTLSIFVSYAFAVKFIRDSRKISGDKAMPWMKAAVIFNAVSSLGAFALAYMMATQQLHQRWYLGSIYFFLHFQYNGWFFFGCMGLLIDKLSRLKIETKNSKIIFRLFLYACIPGYLLSVLWLKFPLIIYFVLILAAVGQLAAWFLLIKNLTVEKEKLKNGFSRIAGNVLKLSAVALTIKLLLQFGSIHPSLSQIAFGFRPIIIGYLHLVLLGIITLFLLGMIITEKIVIPTGSLKYGLMIFVSGIFLNEIILMIQGSLGMGNIPFPEASVILFLIALLMFTGIALIIYSALRGNKKGALPDSF